MPKVKSKNEKAGEKVIANFFKGEGEHPCESCWTKKFYDYMSCDQCKVFSRYVQKVSTINVKWAVNKFCPRCEQTTGKRKYKYSCSECSINPDKNNDNEKPKGFILDWNKMTKEEQNLTEHYSD